MTDKKKLNVAVLSIYQELAESLVEMLAPEQMQRLEVGDVEVSVNVMAGAQAQDGEFEDHLAKADAAMVVVRFLDVLSLEKIKALLLKLPAGSDLPVAMVLLRDPGEMDFKISCPACGQKLWLRDTDVGRRGRCPNCKKPFVIMSQADHVRKTLMLADRATVVKVVRGDPGSFGKALEAALSSAADGIRPLVADANAEAMKNVTARIEISENGS